jgi:hypothetical protein
MRFTDVTNCVLRLAELIEAGRKIRKDGPGISTAGQLAWARIPRKRYLRETLSECSAGQLFMLAALIDIGAHDDEPEWNLLDFYCAYSDLAHTPRQAIERILAEEHVFDYLDRGLKRVKAKGIDLDRWMAS